jgi:hypothetical protein
MHSWNQAVQELISENRNKQGFLLLFPLNERMARREALSNLTLPTEHDEVMWLWVREKCVTDQTWC